MHNVAYGLMIINSDIYRMLNFNSVSLDLVNGNCILRIKKAILSLTCKQDRNSPPFAPRVLGILRWFPPNIRAIQAKIKLPQRSHNMVTV